MDQPKVLIVDDDDNNRGVLCDALGGEPYRLLEAADGQQALDIADKELPDLVLLDVLMPGMDGFAILQQLKAQERTHHIPVIMVTALNMDSQISVCLDGGAIDHIVKPFSRLVVRARVRAALRDRIAEHGYMVPAEKQGAGAPGGAPGTWNRSAFRRVPGRRPSPSSRCGPTWAPWPSSSVSPRR